LLAFLILGVALVVGEGLGAPPSMPPTMQLYPQPRALATSRPRQPLVLLVPHAALAPLPQPPQFANLPTPGAAPPPPPSSPALDSLSALGVNPSSLFSSSRPLAPSLIDPLAYDVAPLDLPFHLPNPPPPPQFGSTQSSSRVTPITQPVPAADATATVSAYKGGMHQFKRRRLTRRPLDADLPAFPPMPVDTPDADSTQAQPSVRDYAENFRFRASRPMQSHWRRAAHPSPPAYDTLPPPSPVHHMPHFSPVVRVLPSPSQADSFVEGQTAVRHGRHRSYRRHTEPRLPHLPPPPVVVAA